MKNNTEVGRMKKEKSARRIQGISSQQQTRRSKNRRIERSTGWQNKDSEFSAQIVSKRGWLTNWLRSSFVRQQHSLSLSPISSSCSSARVAIATDHRLPYLLMYYLNNSQIDAHLAFCWLCVHLLGDVIRLRRGKWFVSWGGSIYIKTLYWRRLGTLSTGGD